MDRAGSFPFIFLGPLARGRSSAARENIMGFPGGIINFVRHQTVLPGMTYLSRRAATSLSVRMRSVA